jgi:Kef-type K+ transport system membrane component KefB
MEMDFPVIGRAWSIYIRRKMDFLNPYAFLIAASIIIILSYFFSGLARKTHIPSVVLLIGLGIGIAWILEIMEIRTGIEFFRVLEVVGVVGLIMIVLEGALDLRLTAEKKALVIRSFLVALLGLLGTAACTAYLLHLFLGLEPLYALIHAIPLAVLSSAIVIPSVSRLEEDKKEFLVYESTFSDILGILMFNMTLANAEASSAVSITMDVVVNLGTSTAIALVISVFMIYLFQRIQGGTKLFFLISILVLLFATGKLLHLSALVIILIFGLVLNNVDVFFRGRYRSWIQPDVLHQVVEHFHVVTRESAFVVRTFFFVIFGMVLSLGALLNLDVAIVSVGILFSMYVVRLVFLVVAGVRDLLPQAFIAPRGLVTVLLYFSIPQEFHHPSFDPGILLYIILGTSVIMSAGLIAYGKRASGIHTLTFPDWDALDSEIERLEGQNPATGGSSQTRNEGG